MFVNYFRQSARASPVNLMVARMLLGGYIIWKTIWYDWWLLSRGPYFRDDVYAFLIPFGDPWILVMEQWILIAVKFAFIIGYRLGLSSFLGSALTAHLAGVRAVYNFSGGTTALFFACFFVIFFGLYRDQDKLSMDEFRRTADRSLDSLNRRLKSDVQTTYPAQPLAWALLVFAIVYFGAGVDKLVSGWWFDAATVANLRRIFVTMMVLDESMLEPVRALVVDQPLLATGAAWGTLLIELGLLPAVLLGVGVIPLLLGVVGMTTGIAVSMGILFGDVYVFLALFVDWERLHRWGSLNRSVDLIYDETCRVCVRSLYPFKLLDVESRITFYSQSDAPAQYRNAEEVNFERSMYVFTRNEVYEGFYAFRYLIGQFRLLLPVVWIMRVRAVEWVGERAYRAVADNRSEYFSCQVEELGSET